MRFVFLVLLLYLKDQKGQTELPRGFLTHLGADKRYFFAGFRIQFRRLHCTRSKPAINQSFKWISLNIELLFHLFWGANFKFASLLWTSARTLTSYSSEKVSMQTSRDSSRFWRFFRPKSHKIDCKNQLKVKDAGSGTRFEHCRPQNHNFWLFIGLIASNPPFSPNGHKTKTKFVILSFNSKMLQNWLQSEPELQRKQLNGSQEYRWLIKQGHIM